MLRYLLDPYLTYNGSQQRFPGHLKGQIGNSLITYLLAFSSFEPRAQKADEMEVHDDLTNYNQLSCRQIFL